MSDGLPVVLVDLDGTVLRSSAGRHAMLGAVADVAGRPVDDMDRATFTGRTDAWIAAELLRRAGHPADPAGVSRVHARYLELLGRDPLLTPVTGILAAQEIKPQARVLAEDRGIRCVVLDYHALRGVERDELTLF